MRAVVIVSSKTGNTYKIARFVQKGFGYDCSLKRIEDQADLSAYDIVMVGFWLDSGHVDHDALALLKSLKFKKVGIFGTLGGDPKSEAAAEVLQSAVDALNEGSRGNLLLGAFLVQGKISCSVLNMLHEKFPHLKQDQKHLQRIAEASAHPDAYDRIKALLNGQHWRQKALKITAKGYGNGF